MSVRLQESKEMLGSMAARAAIGAGIIGILAAADIAARNSEEYPQPMTATEGAVLATSYSFAGAAPFSENRIVSGALLALGTTGWFFSGPISERIEQAASRLKRDIETLVLGNPRVDRARLV